MVDQVELRSKLLELAGRCEMATGADGDLERAIKAALLGREYISFKDDLAKRQAASPPRYTSSLDAAITLVPKECKRWELRHKTIQSGFPVEATVETEKCIDSSVAATPALALCAAALRARKDIAE